MENSESVRLPKEFKEFLERLEINRVRAETDDKVLRHPGAVKVIVKYFKANNIRYLELINMVNENA